MHNKISINFLGDIMLGERFEKFKRGVKSKIEKESVNPFEFCKKDLLSSDLNIGNLECVVSTTSTKSFPFSEFMKTSENNLKLLTENNIRIVNIANNHIFDHGVKAFDELKEILERNEIKYFGFGNGNSLQTEPLEVSVKEKTFGFLGYDLSNTTRNEFEEKTINILSILKNLRKKNDFLVLSLHWGYEYVDIPTSFMIEAAKKFISNGVDLIYGHHPHILQGVTQLNNKIFAPSLGNFIFDDERTRNRFTGILNVNIDKENKVKYYLSPYFINENFQPVPAPEKKEEFQLLTKQLVEQINISGNELIIADKKIISSSKKGHMLNKKRVRKEILIHFKNYLPFLYQIFKYKVINKRLRKIA